MSLAHHIDDIIALYVVSGLGVQKIARRYGVESAAVELLLADAGVELRPLKWRNSFDAAAARSDARLAPPAPRGDGSGYGPDLRHCLAVVRALGGRGFPFVDPARGAP